MTAHGRYLVQLAGWLDGIEAELIKTTDWLDQEGGNQRTAGLLDGAVIRIGAAVRQLQRDIEAADARDSTDRAFTEQIPPGYAALQPSG